MLEIALSPYLYAGQTDLYKKIILTDPLQLLLGLILSIHILASRLDSILTIEVALAISILL